MDEGMERSHLRKAEADIADARVRIQRQEQLILRLEMDGHNAEIAKSLLETMQETLRAMEQHRGFILGQLSSFANGRRPT
jgi:hypothetical protein